ncbi:Eukaryotic translation initiation factor 3 subunit g [Thalictrum thalictroides]|uniref:Eukaryotic translation initiation factor 3 subunit G n=1 Tax=Thalictrum thalictroides TaxID=46969 RepID=A0A7J6WH17_THATH|nr:Eukaryotic translation initiation factor 3 subunit g [Thalictrum thalictroides]
MTIAMERPASANQSTKPRWGDLEDDDDRGEDYGYFAPPEVVTEPDEHGVKKVISYKIKDDGRKAKITTTIRIRKLAKARLSKRAIERRSWPKFGDAANKDDGARLTMVSTEEIIIERPRAPGSKADDIKAPGDPLAQLGKGGAVLMVCRTCGKKGDHWTSKCPYKDLAPPPEGFVDKPTSEAPSASSGATKGTYVPPSQRQGADRSGQEMRRRNDENSVRVTNLSEDTREPDLQDLFSTFGPVSRVYIAYDQKTGMSRGFGFVNFVHKSDAEKAIAKLNGYGYDNLILRVEWAAPRTN